MRISELSRRSGVPLPSIKYYLREGLLPGGRSTGANQADYGDEHVTRLRLIRSLLEIGGLSVASARGVIAAIDAPDLPIEQVLGAAQYAISQASLYTSEPSETSRSRIDAAVAARGWSVTADAPARTGAANVLDAFESIGHPELAGALDGYLEAAETVARADIAAMSGQGDIDSMAEIVVAGTVLGDALFAALRRLAQEHVTVSQYSVGPASDLLGRTETRMTDPARSAR